MVCPKPSRRTARRAGPRDRANRSEHRTTAAAPSVICEQSVTFSGGADPLVVGGLRTCGVERERRVTCLAHGLSRACRRLLKATSASCFSVEPVSRLIQRGDAREELGEHELAVNVSLRAVIPRRPEHLGAVGRRHRLLLLGADDENDVVEAGHDLLGTGQHRRPAQRARRLDVHRGNAAQLRVDFGEQRPEVELAGKQAAGEIPDDAGGDVARFNSPRGDGLAPRLADDVAQPLALLDEVPLEVRTRGADQINGCWHSDNLRQARVGGRLFARAATRYSTPHG